MSGKSLTDKMDLLRFCQKGLFDFDGGNQLKNSPPAPIYHFQRISNVSPSSSGQSEASFKTFFNTVPKNTFWDIFYGLLPNLMKNFQKAFRLDTHKKKYRHPWNPKSTLHIFWRKSDFVVVGGVGGWRGYLYVGERSTNSDSPFHSNCKDWFQLIFHLELAVNSFAS